eukprot:EG_transcript_4320
MLELGHLRHVKKKHRTVSKHSCYVFTGAPPPRASLQGAASPLALPPAERCPSTELHTASGDDSQSEAGSESPTAAHHPRRARSVASDLSGDALAPQLTQFMEQEWQLEVAQRLAAFEGRVQRVDEAVRAIAARQRQAEGVLRMCLVMVGAQCLLQCGSTLGGYSFATNATLVTLLALGVGTVWLLHMRRQLQAAPVLEPSLTPDAPMGPLSLTPRSPVSSSHIRTLQQFCLVHGLVMDHDMATGACFVLDVTDSRQPIAFASQGFLDMTGYEKTELEGIDSRFLLGPATTEASIRDLQATIEQGKEGAVSITQYIKSGVPFLNHLLLTPLKDTHGKAQYYLAMQGSPSGDGLSEVSFSSKSSESVDSAISSGDEPILAAYVPCTVPDPTRTALKVAVLDPTLTRTTAVYFPNTGELIPFENSTFKGVVHCRTRLPGDTYFMGKRRAFEIQIQGQFQRKPQGVVWFGAEVPRPMSLSRFKRMVCGVLLKLVATFGHRSHVSFADSRVPGDMPHIVCPALSAMDRVIVTPPGQTPPTLGENLPVSDEMAALKALPSQPEDFLVGHTYTLAFYSHYIDFERWAVVEIPGFGALDLHSFWADMSLRFVFYAHPADQPHHLVHERDPIVQFEIIHRTLPRYKELPMPQYTSPSAAPNG